MWVMCRNHHAHITWSVLEVTEGDVRIILGVEGIQHLLISDATRMMDLILLDRIKKGESQGKNIFMGVFIASE
jgi:hypothetical protein